MGSVSFNPSGELIVLRLQVGGADPDTFRNVTVALDTGATITIIPSQVLIALGYDLLNPEDRVQLLTASGPAFAKRINVRRLTAIGETIENIDVLCHDLPGNSPIKGLLGLNFLRHFDVNISFSTATIELLPR
ncbi:MAG: retropepsin-like aspartic protease [Candidatus Poribacteria bacterium]|nr:retropepsin-like aspartic protease [Candidatus Poribacteria bacterium]